VILLQQPSVQD